VNPAEKDEACAESVCSREWDDKKERGVIGKTKGRWSGSGWKEEEQEEEQEQELEGAGSGILRR
jgi:hypothetical protein